MVAMLHMVGIMAVAATDVVVVIVIMASSSMGNSECTGMEGSENGSDCIRHQSTSTKEITDL